eukprot:m.97138 g.97138  ORF g.97138 m.97138 type:complete len:404 (+) comp13582_c0_seq5:103-1314(+)
MDNNMEVDDDAVMLNDEDIVQVIDPAEATDEELAQVAAHLGVDEDDDDPMEEDEGDDAGEFQFPDTDDSVMKFEGHKGPVFCVAVHPEKNIVVSGGEDDMAYLWDSSTGTILHKLSGHTDSVTCVGFNRGGVYVATGSLDGVIQVWSTEDVKLVCKLDCEDDLLWFDWHPVANFIVAGADSGSTFMWDVPGGNTTYFSGHTAAVSCGAWAPSGRNFVTGAQDGSMILWSPKTATVVSKFDVKSDHRFHQDAIVCFDWHPDSSVVVSGDSSGKIVISHAKNGKVVAALSTGDQSVEAISISTTLPTLLAIGTLEGTIIIMDLNTHRELRRFSHQAGVVKLKWNDQGKHVFSCSLDGTVQVWDTSTGQQRGFTGHRDQILDFSCNKSQNTIVSSSEDGKCLVFNL